LCQVYDDNVRPESPTFEISDGIRRSRVNRDVVSEFFQFCSHVRAGWPFRLNEDDERKVLHGKTLHGYLCGSELATALTGRAVA